MKIDRSNYEIWLIDYLDGNLSDQQMDQLNLFLTENPDLKEEFNELADSRLVPSDRSFPNKERLKKSPHELPSSQFEYLSVANLENDLDGAQKKELTEIIENDPTKKEVFEQIQKLRLTPGKISYKDKNLLLKRSLAQRVIRLSVISLSAAATIALFVSIYLFLPERIPSDMMNSANNNPAELKMQDTSAESVPEKIAATEEAGISDKQEVKLIASAPDYKPVILESAGELIEENDPTEAIAEYQNFEIKMISLNPKVEITGNTIHKTLIASDISQLLVKEDESGNPVEDKSGNPVGRFLAKNFREKILKEPAPRDSPIKAYEIAEAGVTGLNKLFGWEIALDKNKNEDGELQSVYFSSRMLKFNAPVKNGEPLP